MKISIHQPDYAPYFRCFCKMYMLYVFVFYMIVSFKKYFKNRNRVNNETGRLCNELLTVSLQSLFTF